MANEVSLGTRRVGDMFDFDKETPHVKVVLENSERGIGVTIPWSDDDDPYASWFLRDSGVIRIPAPNADRPIPKKIIFRDSYGCVMLIGCHARGYHRNFMGPGSGTLWARAAIIGVESDLDFESPHGLHTDISGLRAWVGESSWRETHNRKKFPTEITIQSKNATAIDIGEYRGINLVLRFGRSLQHENDGDRRILIDSAWCETQTTKPTVWADHLKIHHAIRDLLVLSRWHNESCIESSVMHLDDRVITMDGKTHGTQWRTVTTPNTDRQSSPTTWQPHLIEYKELGEAGLLNWLSLRDEFARALDPVITSINLRNATPNTLLAHTGPGLEALGYLLMLRDNVSKSEASKASLKTRFERILEDLVVCLPFDTDAWVDSTCAAYNGLKHANRKEPDPVDVINSWRESVMVARAWVAAELGIPKENIKNRLAMDPQRHRYKKWV